MANYQFTQADIDQMKKGSTPEQYKSILQSLQDQGILPPDFADNPNITAGSNQQSNSQSQLPTFQGKMDRSMITRMLSSLPSDLSSLSEGELQDYISRFEGITNDRNIGSIDEGLVENTIFSILTSNGISEPNSRNLAANLTAAQRSTGSPLTNNQISEYAKGNYPESIGQGIVNQISSALQKGIGSGEFTTVPPELNRTLADLKGLLNQKTGKATQEQGIQSYLSGLPAENERIIGDYEKALQTSQSDFFTNELTPSIIQSLNARGLIHSGDLTSSLAETGGKLQRGIRDTIAPLRASFATDLSNKKYENLLRGALEQGQSLTSAVDFTRNMFKTNQSNQFLSGENSLTRQNQSDIANKNIAMQLALMGGGAKSPSALDYFLQYGLPVASNLAGNYLSGYGMGQGFATK